MTIQPLKQPKVLNLIQTYLSQQPTESLPMFTIPDTPPLSLFNQPVLSESAAPLTTATKPEASETVATKKLKVPRILAVTLLLAFAVALYLIWRPTASTTPVASITPSNNTSALITQKNTPGTDGGNATSSEIQVYVAGAVLHPGVYTLEVNARTYQLLQAAGGPLPNANLVALNLAQHLNDGQEVYVTRIGETAPVTTGSAVSSSTPGSNTASTSIQGQPLNLNSASADELRQQLHVSSKTAQAIVNYRMQHGSFTSVDELLQVVSKTIYNKIKDMVSV